MSLHYINPHRGIAIHRYGEVLIVQAGAYEVWFPHERNSMSIASLMKSGHGLPALLEAGRVHVGELRHQADELEMTIATLSREHSEAKATPGGTGPSEGRAPQARKPMSAAKKKALSKRMKAYWAEKRAKAKKA